MYRRLPIPRRLQLRPLLESHPHYSTQSGPENNGTSSHNWKEEAVALRKRANAWKDLGMSLLRERASTLSSSASITLQDMGVKLNEVTGYNEIEALKRRVVELEQRIAETRQSSKDAKVAYETAVSDRSTCQKEVNDLLQRKSGWSESDVLRFTALVRQDHLNEQREISTKLALAESEASVEREFNELMRAILNRYHEEQIWSDKIRSASTYGSLLVIGVNVAVFVLAIVLVEPYKRKKLAQTFEARIEEIQRENKELIGASMAHMALHFEKQEATLDQINQTATQLSSAPATESSPTEEPTTRKSPADKAFDDLANLPWNLGDVTRRDLTTFTISTVFGGVVVGIVTTLINR